WRLTKAAQIAPGFGNGMEAAMAGRIGNTVTINGSISKEVPVKAGERIRLRLINCSLARVMALRFEGHRPLVIATDGQPGDPHNVGPVLPRPAMRIDIILDMQGGPGRRYRVTDDFYKRLAYWLTELVYDKGPRLSRHSLDPVKSLPRNALPEPDLA